MLVRIYLLPLALSAQSVPRLNILRFIGVDFSECRSLSCPQTSYCAYLVRVIPVAPRANFFTGCFILADNLPQPRRFYSKYLRGFSCRNKVRMRIVFAFLNAEERNAFSSESISESNKMMLLSCIFCGFPFSVSRVNACLSRADCVLKIKRRA